MVPKIGSKSLVCKGWNLVGRHVPGGSSRLLCGASVGDLVGGEMPSSGALGACFEIGSSCNMLDMPFDWFGARWSC